MIDKHEISADSLRLQDDIEIHLGTREERGKNTYVRMNDNS